MHHRSRLALIAIVLALTALAFPSWAGPLRVAVSPIADRTGRVPADVLGRADARLRQRLAEVGRFAVIVAAGTPQALALVADAVAMVTIERDDRGHRLAIGIRSLPSMNAVEDSAATFDGDARDLEASLLRAVDAAARALGPVVPPPRVPPPQPEPSYPSQPQSPPPSPSLPRPRAAPPRAWPRPAPSRGTAPWSVLLDLGIHNQGRSVGFFRLGLINGAQGSSWSVAEIGLANHFTGQSFNGLVQLGAWSTVPDGDMRAAAQLGAVAVTGKTFEGLVQAGVVAASWGKFRGVVQIGAVSYVGWGLFRELHLPTPTHRGGERHSFQGLAQIGGMAATDADFDGLLQAGLFSTAFGDFHGGLELGVINYVDHTFHGFAQIGGANVAHHGFEGAFRIGVVNVAGTYVEVTHQYEQLGVTGAEIGAVNVDLASLTGLQIGVVNAAHHVRGVQIGALNLCEELHGLQIGVINVCTKALAPALPIFNLGW